MKNTEFKLWREIMGYSQEEAAKALGISRLTIQNYERGSRLEDGRPVIIPRAIALACAALEAGLDEWQGMTAAEVKNGDDGQAFVNWCFARAHAATERYNDGAMSKRNRDAMDRTEKAHDEAIALMNSFDEEGHAAVSEFCRAMKARQKRRRNK